MDNKKTVAITSLWDQYMKPNWSLILSGVSAYSVAVGMAYLWGYWAPFDINILEYMGVADILTATAWPLFSVFSAMFAGMLLGSHDGGTGSQGGSDRFGRALVWYWTHLRALHFLGLFWIWFLDLPNKWFLLGLLGGTPLAVYVMHRPWIEAIQIPSTPKLVIVFFFITAPLAAISTGQRLSAELIAGQSYRAVYSEIEGRPFASSTTDDARLRLIGQRGDTLFLWDPTLKRTVISKFPSAGALVLGRVNKPAGEGAWESLRSFATRHLNL
jgi:hypothetical protein